MQLSISPCITHEAINPRFTLVPHDVFEHEKIIVYISISKVWYARTFQWWFFNEKKIHWVCYFPDRSLNLFFKIFIKKIYSSSQCPFCNICTNNSVECRSDTNCKYTNGYRWFLVGALSIFSRRSKRQNFKFQSSPTATFLFWKSVGLSEKEKLKYSSGIRNLRCDWNCIWYCNWNSL